MMSRCAYLLLLAGLVMSGLAGALQWRGIAAAAAGGVHSTLHPVQRREVALPAAREETAAASVGGRLYVIGGFDSAGRDTDTVYVFDGRRWAIGPRLPLAVDHAAAAVLGGRLYVAGGFTGGSVSGRAFVLSPSGRSWSGAGTMQHARGALALVAVGAHLYAVGGKDAAGIEIGPVEAYTPGSRTWTDIGTLPAPRDHLAGFPYHGWACVAGGRSPTSARVDCYDPARRTWRRLPSLPKATSGAGAVSYVGAPVVGGGELAGEAGGVVAQLAYLQAGKWRAGSMLVPRHGLQFALFSGRIWACGGGIAPGLHPVSICTSIAAGPARP